MNGLRNTGYRIRTGRRGEAIAVRYYRRQGWVAIDKNYRTPYGEIDLILYRPLEIRFVEVKTRRNNRFGEPQEQVLTDKLEHFCNSGLFYVQQRGYLGIYTFEVCAINLTNIRANISIFCINF